MRGLHRRLSRLEKESPHAFKPWLILVTWDDQTYTGNGHDYNAAELAKLESDHRLIIFEYTDQPHAAQA